MTKNLLSLKATGIINITLFEGDWEKKVDLGTVPESSIEHLFRYGWKQSLKDSAAGEKDYKRHACVDQRLQNIYGGKYNHHELDTLKITATGTIHIELFEWDWKKDVDLGTVPASSIEYLFRYGWKQLLADSAGGKQRDERDKNVEKKLEEIRAGTLKFNRSMKEQKIADVFKHNDAGWNKRGLNEQQKIINDVLASEGDSSPQGTSHQRVLKYVKERLKEEERLKKELLLLTGNLSHLNL